MCGDVCLYVLQYERYNFSPIVIKYGQGVLSGHVLGYRRVVVTEFGYPVSNIQSANAVVSPIIRWGKFDWMQYTIHKIRDVIWT